MGRKMMTIGEQLKKFRLLLGLAQQEMAAGIVTPSFYSRVERDLNEITIDKLVEILNIHDISLYDFFSVFDSENLPTSNLVRKMYLYFDNRDLDKMIELKKSVKNRDALLYLKLKLIIADLKGSVNKIPRNKQEELKDLCLKEDINLQKDFWNIAISTSLYRFDELTGIVKYILNNSTKFDLNNEQLLLSLLNLLIQYLDRCYQEKQYAELKQVKKFVNTLPNQWSIVFHKLLVKYYFALFNNEYDLASKILDLICQSGYQHYAKTLPQIEGEDIC